MRPSKTSVLGGQRRRFIAARGFSGPALLPDQLVKFCWLNLMGPFPLVQADVTGCEAGGRAGEDDPQGPQWKADRGMAFRADPVGMR